MTSSLERRFAECQRCLGYRFRNIKFLQKALTHSSAAETALESNERMEFLGDGVLGLAVVDLLYHHYPDQAEGPLSIIKGTVVSRRSCTQIARSLGLERFILLGRGFDEIPDSLLANLLEAIIAAVYLDGGVEAAVPFVQRIFLNAVEEAHEEINRDNFKSLLQNELHRRFPGTFALYRLLDEKGPGHHKCFLVQVINGSRVFQAAWGNTKKIAEQKAAENALAQLHGEVPPWPDGN